MWRFSLCPFPFLSPPIPIHSIRLFRPEMPCHPIPSTPYICHEIKRTKRCSHITAKWVKLSHPWYITSKLDNSCVSRPKHPIARFSSDLASGTTPSWNVYGHISSHVPHRPSLIPFDTHTIYRSVLHLPGVLAPIKMLLPKPESSPP